MFILNLSISLNYLQDQENNEEACLLFATNSLSYTLLYSTRKKRESKGH